MNTNRREFLKTCISLSSVLFIPWDRLIGIQTEYAKAQNWARFTQLPKMLYRLHGFNETTYGEETLIAKAMQLLQYRFFSKLILHNAYQHSGTNFNIQGGYWDACKLWKQAYMGKSDLLQYQIKCLTSLRSFPDFNIHSFYKDSDVLGQAEVARVKIIFDTPNYFFVNGSFNIELNRYHLGQSGEDSNPNRWAAVIAHEMLHNLGHLHGDGDFSEQLQIIAFERAVYYNGSWGYNDYIPSRYDR